MDATLHLLIPKARAGERYGRFGPPLEPATLPDVLPPGSIIAIRAGLDDTDALDALYDATARRVPAAAIVLWVDPAMAQPDELIRATTVGADGNVFDGAPRTTWLREQLTPSPARLAPLVCQWAERRYGRDLVRRLDGLLEQLVSLAAAHSCLNSLVAKSGRSEATWRRRFTRAGCSLSAWHAAIRYTVIALELQRSPDVTVEQLAFRFGLSSGSALGDRLARVTGARPSFIRHRLGWQWLLSSAVRQSDAISPPGSSTSRSIRLAGTGVDE